eukprot:655844-Pelagomonas_calceolata.AAC.3
MQACTQYHERADTDPWDGIKATADAGNYLRGCIWLLDMYINGMEANMKRHIASSKGPMFGHLGMLMQDWLGATPCASLGPCFQKQSICSLLALHTIPCCISVYRCSQAPALTIGTHMTAQLPALLGSSMLVSSL